jgi:hypothetical protein
MSELVRVWTDIGGPKPVAILARIIEKNGTQYKIQYFSPSEDRDHGRIVYKYEDEVYDIDDDSVTEYLDSMNESDIGYVQVGDNAWIRDAGDSDEDYVPSDEDEDVESIDEEESFEDDEEEFLDEE